MTTGFFKCCFWSGKGENRWRQRRRSTCVTRYIQDRKSFVRVCVCGWVVGLGGIAAHLHCRACWWNLTHVHLVPPGGHPEKCPLYETTHWNTVRIISLSYITSFLQHKNRSLTMITICLNVNIQYLLHFFPDKPVSHLLFVIITPLKKKEKKKEGKKERSTGTDDSKKRFM